MISCMRASFISAFGTHNHSARYYWKSVFISLAFKAVPAIFAIHNISKILLAMRSALKLSLQRKSPYLHTTWLTGLC